MIVHKEGPCSRRTGFQRFQPVILRSVRYAVKKRFKAKDQSQGDGLEAHPTKKTTVSALQLTIADRETQDE
jgi:hypothetical protein